MLLLTVTVHLRLIVMDAQTVRKRRSGSHLYLDH